MGDDPCGSRFRQSAPSTNKYRHIAKFPSPLKKAIGVHPRSSSGSSLTSAGSNPSSFNRRWKFLWRRSSRSSNNNEDDDDDDDDAVDDDILLIMKHGVPCGLLLFCLFGIICCFPPFLQRYAGFFYAWYISLKERRDGTVCSLLVTHLDSIRQTIIF